MRLAVVAMHVQIDVFLKAIYILVSFEASHYVGLIYCIKNVKAIFIIFFLNCSPKIRVCRLFDGTKYSRMYGMFSVL